MQQDSRLGILPHRRGPEAPESADSLWGSRYSTVGSRVDVFGWGWLWALQTHQPSIRNSGAPKTVPAPHPSIRHRPPRRPNLGGSGFGSRPSLRVSPEPCAKPVDAGTVSHRRRPSLAIRGSGTNLSKPVDAVKRHRASIHHDNHDHHHQHHSLNIND